MKSILENYLKNIAHTYQRGDAREESYYKHLEKLIRDHAELNKIRKVDVTVLPKKTEAGNPDFRIWDGKNHITGYIEAKDPSVTNLDHIQSTDQLKRYLSTFPNLILTNFLEFRLYRDGQLVDQVVIGREMIAKKLKMTPPAENIEKFSKLLELFFSFSLPRLNTAKSLAVELAKRTRFLRDEVIAVEMEEQEKGHKMIHEFYQAFKKYLISNLTEKQFADLYSQTIAYGLFAARTRADGEFNRQLAFNLIPHTIGILRDVFKFISFEQPPKSLQVIVDDIAEILQATDIDKILHHYQQTGKGKDSVIHFYETFLETYDPEVRERRGVYYTPEPVVGYIVRSVHQILKIHFNLSEGLASEEVKLLDPASGTMTFPAEAVKVASEEYKGKYGSGGLDQWIKNHILENFYAFELMMAPYAIGHLKMGVVFEELGYKLEEEERFKLYLTNTLEMEEIEQVELPGLSSLSEESHLAGKVKKDQPILVILGNPPYSGISSNKNEWTERLLKQDIDGTQSYYKIDDKPLNEQKLWLQDDYVKFLRFAQWKIEKSGYGIVGMITNHSYLDNPTFRGMRQSLTRTFDHIYLLDLHGSSLKSETTPEGKKDENVFDIRQGVAIALFIKSRKKQKSKIYHLDLYGLREKKYNWLEKNDFQEKNYIEIKPQSPWYFFKPRNIKGIFHYLNWNKINEIFPINVTGIITARNKFVIGFDKKEIKNKILQFINKDLSDEFIREAYKLKNTRGWDLSIARKILSKDKNWDSYYKNILYRPFDKRIIYYTDKMVDWGRFDLMPNMLKENLALLTCRQIVTKKWKHALISNKIIDESLISNKTKERTYFYPLYIYSEKDKKDLFSENQKEKRPNIPGEIFDMLEKSYKHKPIPEDILYYIYGVFYSNIYREKYAEYLKIDFPRVPFTVDYKLFQKMGKLGKQLAGLHLLNSSELDQPIAKYQGTGENHRVEKITYNPDRQRIYINKDKYFEGVKPEVWNYPIGGYQVLKKYLKDRKDRVMDDPPRYCKIITALSKTIEIQSEIDRIYPEIEKNLIEI